MTKSENEYSLPQVPYFCISCVYAISLSCFTIITESRILLKNMIFPFLVGGVCGNPSFVSVVSCGYKNETSIWHSILNVLQKPLLLNFLKLSLCIHIATDTASYSRNFASHSPIVTQIFNERNK